MDDTLKKVIVLCIEKSLGVEDFTEITVNLTGTNAKGEGSIAEFIFATATGTNKENRHKKIYLAVKFGKRSKNLRENLPVIIDCYRREVFFYSILFPAFHKFQSERNLDCKFSAIPKCYGTFLSDEIEALVFEDLKNKGFRLHNKKVTMNLHHTKLVLKMYAEFHAISFALRDQDEDKFQKLTADYKSIMRTLILKMGVVRNDDTVQNRLREFGREDLAEKYEKETEKGKADILLNVLDDIPRESVVIHGDCHNNNFLFQYKDDDQKSPINISIIDWQLSEIHSPVIDLSYFLYCSASKAELSKLDELLDFYHLHLTTFLRKLGSDATKVFPYSTLIEHWRKYSIYAFTFGSSVLQNFYIENEDAPMENLKFEIDGSYRERLISLVEHYFNFVL